MAVRQLTGTRSSGDAPWRRATWPEVQPGTVGLAYDRLPLDTLYVAFEDDGTPGSYVPVTAAEEPYDGLYVKVSEDGSRVTGAMIEGYLVGAHSRWPSWLDVAAAAGISDDALGAFGLAPRTPGLDRDAAVAAFLAEIRNAWETARDVGRDTDR